MARKSHRDIIRRTPWSQAAWPTLTTVSYQLEQTAKETLKMLGTAHAGKQKAAELTRVAARLIVRETSIRAAECRSMLAEAEEARRRQEGRVMTKSGLLLVLFCCAAMTSSRAQITPGTNGNFYVEGSDFILSGTMGVPEGTLVIIH